MFKYFRSFISRGLCSKCEKKVAYLNKRVESLTKSIGEAIMPITINEKIQTLITPNIRGINAVIADLKYGTFTYNDWQLVISRIYDSVRSKEKYTCNVFDCDDFALLFSGIMTYSTFKSGFSTQVAFGIAWSNIHAFNIFIDNKNDVYIYEPQNNKIMTFAEANKQESYKVRKIWFMS